MIEFINTHQRLPVIEEGGALSVEFTRNAFDYIMELGGSMDDASEYIVWKGNGRPISPSGSPKFKYNSPRTWVSIRTRQEEEREHIILNEARNIFVNYTSTVLDVQVNRGQTVMLTSIPEELKRRYNCSSVQTISQDAAQYGMDISMVTAGMKVKMQLFNVVAHGGYAQQPFFHAVPDARYWQHGVAAPKAMKPKKTKKNKKTRSRKASHAPRPSKPIKPTNTRFQSFVTAEKAAPAPRLRLSNEELFPKLGSAAAPTKKSSGAWGKKKSTWKLQRKRGKSFFNSRDATVLSSSSTDRSVSDRFRR